MHDIIDPFHRQLRAVLDEDLTRRIVALSEGSAARVAGGVEEVAEKYAAQVSYIKALRDLIEKCEELEKEIYGPKPAQS